jgi:hypothetical protein
MRVCATISSAVASCKKRKRREAAPTGAQRKRQVSTGQQAMNEVRKSVTSEDRIDERLAGLRSAEFGGRCAAGWRAACLSCTGSIPIVIAPGQRIF